MSRLKTIQLQVPEGAEAGDSLTFSVGGKELEFPIPNDSKPGDVLQIQIEVKNEDGDDDGTRTRQSSSNDPGTPTELKLHSSIGASLTIHSSIPDRKDSHEDGGSTGTKDGADGTFSMVWPAGLHLAKYISRPRSESQSSMVEAKTVVELGSGSGICGLAFAVTASSKLSKRKSEVKKLNIVLTDLPSAMGLSKYNIKVNLDQLSSHLDESNLRSRSLTWGKEEDIRALDLGDVDLIIGSDLLYNVTMESFKALSSTIQTLDSKGKTKILISVRWRKPEEERKFFQMMESLGYEFQLIEDDDSENPYRCNLDWKDFGNPMSAKSNNFFTNSYVKVDGESKSLKDVSEYDMDVMSDSEFNAFEQRFIQIYTGQKKA